MIDLRKLSQAELLQLYAECEKIRLITLIGVKQVSIDLYPINAVVLSDQVALMQQHILHVLNTPEETI